MNLSCTRFLSIHDHVGWCERWAAEFVRTRDWPTPPARLDSRDTDTRNDAYSEERRNDPADAILDDAPRWHEGLMAAVSALGPKECADSNHWGCRS